MSTSKREYTAWIKETTEQEHVDGLNASYERFIGQRMARVAIAEYNSTWGDHHGREITTRCSARRFANELAYNPEVK
jgi:hypothetical protein